MSSSFAASEIFNAPDQFYQLRNKRPFSGYGSRRSPSEADEGEAHYQPRGERPALGSEVHTCRNGFTYKPKVKEHEYHNDGGSRAPRSREIPTQYDYSQNHTDSLAAHRSGLDGVRDDSVQYAYHTENFAGPAVSWEKECGSLLETIRRTQKVSSEEKQARIFRWLKNVFPCANEAEFENLTNLSPEIKENRPSTSKHWASISRTNSDDNVSSFQDNIDFQNDSNRWIPSPVAMKKTPRWETSTAQFEGGRPAQWNEECPPSPCLPPLAKKTDHVDWASGYASMLIEGHGGFEQEREKNAGKGLWEEPVFEAAALKTAIRFRPKTSLRSHSPVPNSLASHQNEPGNGWAHFGKSSTGVGKEPFASEEITTESCSTHKSLDDGTIIDGKWKAQWRIGAGSFGEVFLGKSLVRGLAPQGVAIKRDRKSNVERLRKEADAYWQLNGLPHFPRVHHQGIWQGYPVLVMDLLGPSLKQLSAYPERLRLSSLLEMALQMIDILQELHGHNIVYRDIKPDNFLLSLDCGILDPNFQSIELNRNAKRFFLEPPRMQRGDRPYLHDVPREGCLPTPPETPTLHLVDFGLIANIGNPALKKPEYLNNCPKKRTGTVKYASLAIHAGYEAGPLDDLEAVAYVLVDLLLGSLPWDSIVGKSISPREKWSTVAYQKKTIPTKDICKGLPRGIRSFLDYTRSADRSCPPDYNRLRDFLRRIWLDTTARIRYQRSQMVRSSAFLYII